MSEANLSRRSFVGALAAGASAAAPQRAGERPNIVFLISDDHSAADLGCYGNSAVRTPRIDRLAGQGMRFTHAFATAPQCSPSRSSYYSGCAPHTIGTSRQASFYPSFEPSVVELLGESGYYTAAFGKVHQGRDFNNRFDWHADDIESFPGLFRNRPKDRPFFAQIGFSEPHRPYAPDAASPDEVKVPAFLPDTPPVREDLAGYYEEIARLDRRIGGVLDRLDEEGLSQETLVVFTSDHGFPFPRGKGTLYEAGIHVPLIVRWPGRARPGSLSDALNTGTDLAATWLDAAGVSPREKMQGRSLLPVVKGEKSSIHEAVFSERNWHNHSDPMRCVRSSRFKLIYNGRPNEPYRPASDIAASPSWRSYLKEKIRGRLEAHHLRLLAPSRPFLEFYDLENDPGEFHNLAEHPDYAKERTRHEMLLSDWMHETLDYLPPLYYGYPAREHPGRRLTV